MANNTIKKTKIVKVYKGKDGLTFRKCLRNDSVNPVYTDCPELDENPYYSFILAITGKEHGRIISTHLGKCLGVGEDGSLVYGIGCGKDDVGLVYKNRTLISKKGGFCAGDGSKCDDIVLEDVDPDTKIWWNINALINSSKSVDEDEQYLKKYMDKSEYRDSFVSIDNLYDIGHDNEGWRFEYFDDYFVDQLYSIWGLHSVVGAEKDKLIAWGGYNSRKKALIVIGPDTIEKNEIIESYSKKYDLRNPIKISHDVPIENNLIYKQLTDLANEIGIYSSDPTIYRSLEKLALEINENIENEAFKYNINIVKDLTHYPEPKDIKKIIDRGYLIKIVIVVPETSVNLERARLAKFRNKGRYGDFLNISDETIQNFRKSINDLVRDVEIIRI